MNSCRCSHSAVIGSFNLPFQVLVFDRGAMYFTSFTGNQQAIAFVEGQHILSMKGNWSSRDLPFP
eukprot:scaffold710_cov171-Amphora_coffeaeformis.AAC.63